MHDLPAQWSIQQSHSRSISGEELEAMGKRAAAAVEGGQAKNLTDAVVMTVKHAGLSPEQVRRVVEFTNTAAYLSDFKKEAGHKIIEFSGGPADASRVIQDLNDGGGGTVFDTGNSDYASAPSEKRASAAHHESDFWGMFEPSQPVVLDQADPMRPAIDFRDKLAGLHDHWSSELSGLETIYDDLGKELTEHVKQAAMSGMSLGDVVYAWSTFVDEPIFVQAAFEKISGALVQSGVFNSFDAVGESIEKVGSQRMVNPEHPIMVLFAGHSLALEKLAEIRSCRDQAASCLEEMDTFLKNPGSTEKTAGWTDRLKALFGGKKAPPPPKGAVQHVRDFFAEKAAPVAGNLAEGAGNILFGKGHDYAKTMKGVTETAVKHVPHAAAGAVGYRALQHLSAAGDNPTMQKLKSYVPGTQENDMYEANLRAQYGGPMAMMQGYGGY